MKAQTRPLEKKIDEQRRVITELRRQVAVLKKQQAILVVGANARAGGEGAPKSANSIRFSAGRVAAERKRLGLSAEDYARLVGVSMVTIYNWEKGLTSRPHGRAAVAWEATVGIGKREARDRLRLLET